MGWNDSTKLILISDHLSPDTAALLGAAKKRLALLHKGDFKHVWVKDGRVLAKVRDNTPFIEIKCLDDIEKAVQYGRDTLLAINLSKPSNSQQAASTTGTTQQTAMDVQPSDDSQESGTV